MLAFLFILRISEATNLKWKYVIKMQIRTEFVIRIVLKKAKNLKIGSVCQVTQIPELKGDLDPVSLIALQQVYSEPHRNNYVFVKENGSQFSTSELFSDIL